MKQRGRPLLGAISGFFLGLFVGLDLLLFGVVPLDSIVITAAPVVGLLLGLVLAFAAPLGRAKSALNAAPTIASPTIAAPPASPPPGAAPPAAPPV